MIIFPFRPLMLATYIVAPSKRLRLARSIAWASEHWPNPSGPELFQPQENTPCLSAIHEPTFTAHVDRYNNISAISLGLFFTFII